MMASHLFLKRHMMEAPHKTIPTPANHPPPFGGIPLKTDLNEIQGKLRSDKLNIRPGILSPLPAARSDPAIDPIVTALHCTAAAGRGLALSYICHGLRRRCTEDVHCTLYRGFLCTAVQPLYSSWAGRGYITREPGPGPCSDREGALI
jgi:hypothetical protein